MSMGTSTGGRPTRGKTHTPSVFLCTQQLCHWLTSQMTRHFPLSIVSSIQGSEYFTKHLEAPGPDSDIRVRFAHISKYSQGETRWHGKTKTKQNNDKQDKPPSIIKPQEGQDLMEVSGSILYTMLKYSLFIPCLANINSHPKGKGALKPPLFSQCSWSSILWVVLVPFRQTTVVLPIDLRCS